QREVGILNRQWRQRIFAALTERVIQRAQLTDENVPRPRVRDDVMKRRQQHMLLLRELEQPQPQHGPVGEIKRLIPFASDGGVNRSLLGGVVQIGQIFYWQ